MQTLPHDHVSRSNRCGRKSQAGILLGRHQTSDGAVKAEPRPTSANQSVSVTPPEWPQPQGIFFNGTQFHPLAFLDKIREMYEKVVIEKASGDLLMEHEAFAWLLMRRTVVLEDRSVVFKMFDLVCPASTADALVVVREGDNYLHLDCLRDST